MNPYILKKNKKHLKGIAFGGCSFTWGQGLHYYNNSPTVVVNDRSNSYRQELLNVTHYEFIKLNRFGGLVAKHFETFAVHQPFNGGANQTSLDWWNEAFVPDQNNLQNYFEGRPSFIDPRDISHFVLQITEWSRSIPTDVSILNYFKNYNIDLKKENYFTLMTDYKDLLIGFLQDNNLTLDDFIINAKKNDITRLKDMLIKIEKTQIKTLVLVWPCDLIDLVLADEWLNSRLVTLKYGTSNYHTINQLILKESCMSIHNDYESFVRTPDDAHPSLKCHRVIADNIIERIRSDFE